MGPGRSTIGAAASEAGPGPWHMGHRGPALRRKPACKQSDTSSEPRFHAAANAEGILGHGSPRRHRGAKALASGDQGPGPRHLPRPRAARVRRLGIQTGQTEQTEQTGQTGRTGPPAKTGHTISCLAPGASARGGRSGVHTAVELLHRKTRMACGIRDLTPWVPQGPGGWAAPCDTRGKGGHDPRSLLAAGDLPGLRRVVRSEQDGAAARCGTRGEASGISLWDKAGRVETRGGFADAAPAQAEVAPARS